MLLTSDEEHVVIHGSILIGYIVKNAKKVSTGTV